MRFGFLSFSRFFISVPRYLHDEAANKCSAEESKNHGFWEKASCDPTAYFTLWLVAFTGVLAVSTIGLGLGDPGLYKIGKRQIELNAEAAAAQSRDMQESIAAAKKSAEVAQDTLTRTGRPFVFQRYGATISMKPSWTVKSGHLCASHTACVIMATPRL